MVLPKLRQKNGALILPRCLGCKRSFRVAKAKHWEDEQLCQFCYHKKHGGQIKGSYRTPGRTTTSYGIARGCGMKCGGMPLQDEGWDWHFNGE